MDIPAEKRFHFRDGTSAGSLDELKAKIEGMSYQEFYNHVNTQKNDFASWIRHVLLDEHLADDLQKVTSIVETVEIINDFLHPRPVIAARTDMQSRIEQNVFSTPLPLEFDRPPVEDVPTIAPGTPRSMEVADFTIIEENQPVQRKVQEELFGSAQPVEPTRPAPSQASQLSSDDMTRMIVKDFMYGLVFGLVIGIILGRLISF